MAFPGAVRGPHDLDEYRELGLNSANRVHYGADMGPVGSHACKMRFTPLDYHDRLHRIFLTRIVIWGQATMISKSIGLATCAALLISSSASASGANAGFLGIQGLFGSRNLALVEPLFGKNDDHCFDRPDRLLTFLNAPQQANDEKSGKKSNSDGIYSSKRAAKCNAIADQFRQQLGLSKSANIPLPYDSIHRNEIIDSMIAISNQKCAAYSAYIKNVDGAVNSSLSIAAILSGGIGPIAGGEATAKALSATSAIFSGARAAINEAYLTNQTIHVLVMAFETIRDKIRDEISAHEACPPQAYTVMRGIEDALRYHNSCSLVVGLGQTAKAVERAGNPGLKEMAETLKQLNAINQAAAGSGATPAATGSAASTATTPKAGETTPSGPAPAASAAATTNPASTQMTALVKLLTQRFEADDTALKAKQTAFDTADDAHKKKLAAYTASDTAKTRAALAKADADVATARKQLDQASVDQATAKLLLEVASQSPTPPAKATCLLPIA